MTHGGAVPGDDVAPVDPFDLPEWLGHGDVVWTATSTLREAHRVSGELGAGADGLPCDLLAVDQAFPRPVVPERWRRAAHAEWSRGEVLLLEVAGRLTLAVPGTAVDANRALEVIGRLARAVGVAPERFVVALRP